MTIALCFAGCASSRKTTLEAALAAASLSRTDSASSEMRLVRLAAVPMSEVRLEIAADSLLRLPEAAQYSGRSGRAGVAVSRAGGVIVVEASCDSLQRVAEWYERTAAAWQERWGEMAALYEEETKRQSNPILPLFAGLAAGGAAGSAITTIIKKRKENGE